MFTESDGHWKKFVWRNVMGLNLLDTLLGARSKRFEDLELQMRVEVAAGIASHSVSPLRRRRLVKRWMLRQVGVRTRAQVREAQNHWSPIKSDRAHDKDIDLAHQLAYGVPLGHPGLLSTHPHWTVTEHGIGKDMLRSHRNAAPVPPETESPQIEEEVPEPVARRMERMPSRAEERVPRAWREWRGNSFDPDAPWNRNRGPADGGWGGKF